jgi:integrating conjugative element membrane protein (TIGR03747 family)
MGDPAAVAQRQQSKPQSWVLTLFTLPLRLLAVLLGSLALSILIECAGTYLLWPDQRWHHAEAMMEHELAQLSTNFTRSVIIREPDRTAHQMVEATRQLLFVETGLEEWFQDTSAQAHRISNERGGFRRFIGISYLTVETYALTAAYTALTFVVRVLVLALTLPLLLTAAFVGLVDGLVRRDVRRFTAGPESGFIFHRARATIAPFLVLPWVVYLSVPFSIRPLWIMLPGACLLCASVDITVSTFKKYL